MGTYGLAIMKMMGQILIVLLLSYYFVVTAHAQENAQSLLQSDDWIQKDKAISMISKRFNQYKNDLIVKQNILNLFRRETDMLKKPDETEKKRGEGYGEYLGDLLFIVIKFDIPEAIPDLLDWANNSPAVTKFIVDHLEKEANHEMKTFLILQKKFMSKGAYYEWRKSGYLSVVCIYLDIVKSVYPKKKSIIKEMLLQQLESKNHFDRQRALQCSRHLIKDSQIIKKLTEISKYDRYFRLKNGKKFYPVRKEANNILEFTKE